MSKSKSTPVPKILPNVGVVGLGSMGYGIATSLLRAGFVTHGFDIDAGRVTQFEKDGGQSNIAADLQGALNVLVVVVVNSAQMIDILFGNNNAAAYLAPGGLVIGCPTISPEAAQAIEARLAAANLLYLDAPISGGAARAAEGALTMMISGQPPAVTAAQPVLSAMAETIFQLGDVAGPASAMKIVNQLLAGVHIAAAAEAITFGLSAGIPAAKTVEVISKCAGTSWMFENRGPHIVDGDYAPRSAVDIFVKDLGIVSQMAKDANFAAPITASALQQFVAASDMGLGRQDDAAVAKVYARAAGLTLPGES
ncbi:MAG: NAD-binding protein [Rhodobacteraceae bacterium]|nr:NAD-binding protein [Paracoccaceae bacterium]MBL4812861.1 NAD-binding protein [Paracoccaceae bacterium]